MAERLRLGTRGSKLALAQADMAKAALEARFPDAEVELCVVKTGGDKDRVRSLVSIGGSGVFVKELEEALLAGEVDFAVHSLKDVPDMIDERLTLAAFLPRDLPNDVLVSGGATLFELPEGAKVGTGSPRRVLQLNVLRPDIRCVDLRGNLETRLSKVEAGELDAVVLGGAGLLRLGLDSRITETFPARLVTPAVGQGIIALECLAENDNILDLLSEVNDPNAKLAANVERVWMRFLGGGCRVPMAAFLEPECGEEDVGYRFYAYLADPATKLFYKAEEFFEAEKFGKEALLEFAGGFVQKCKELGIPLPCEVGENALLNFWDNY